MLRGSRHLGQTLGYSFSPINKFHLSLLGSLASRRTWRHLAATGELLWNRVYNKPNGCSATGALALGLDHQQPISCHIIEKDWTLEGLSLRLKCLLASSRPRPRDFGVPGEANNLLPLQADIILTFYNQGRVRRGFWGRGPKLRIILRTVLWRGESSVC
jgi:hypothetical protein